MKVDQVAGVALVLVGLVVFLECGGLPLGTLRSPGPAFVPVALGIVLVALGVLLAVFGGASPPIRGAGWGGAGHAVAILAACGFAALAVERVGYRGTVALTLFFLLGVVERKPVLLAVAFAVGLAMVTYYVFDTVLRVPLPRGPFGL